MLTVEDLEAPNTLSGYKYVTYLSGERPAGSSGFSPGRKDKYRAHIGSWYGPCRPTAIRAAFDVCVRINYGVAMTLAPLPGYAAPEIDMGGSRRLSPTPESVTVKREHYVGPHDLYDVLILSPNGETVCRKIGITSVGRLRYADICTTWGCSIKPVVQAKTFPSKIEALAAEAKRVAEVCEDGKWRRVAKEAFAPEEASTA